jgi:uncharacterized protein YndB with AHSA1/START domain
MTEQDALDDDLVIEPTFDAPTDLIWQMWTDPDQFKAWYRPSGASVPVARMDVRVGGTRFVCMSVDTPAGPMKMWFTGEYLEVVTDQRLVYTESMADEHGNVLSPSDVGLPAGHPTTTEVKVELEEVAGRTRMVLTHAGVPSDSPGATGWQAAFEKLANYVGAAASRPT